MEFQDEKKNKKIQRIPMSSLNWHKIPCRFMKYHRILWNSFEFYLDSTNLYIFGANY
jgi:hypothetical protein